MELMELMLELMELMLEWILESMLELMLELMELMLELMPELILELESGGGEVLQGPEAASSAELRFVNLPSAVFL